MSNLGVLGVFRLKFYFFEHTIMIYVQNVCHVLAFSERSEHFLFLQFVGPGQLKLIPPPPPDLDDWVIPEDRHSMPCCVQLGDNLNPPFLVQKCNSSHKSGPLGFCGKLVEGVRIIF